MKKLIAVTVALVALLAFYNKDATQRVPSGEGSGDYGVAEYAADCERELGRIPPFGCFQGQIVPILNSDRPVHDEAGTRPLEITDENYEGNGQHCDSPSLLQQDSWVIREVARLAPCVPHTRLGTSPAQAGFPTKWVWTCRRYFPRPADDWHFDDINMIGHNPETGATCFFVSNINRFMPSGGEDLGNNGAYVPSPSGPYGARFWKTPDQLTNRASWQGGSQKCTDCHDNDPFVHTPFIQQVTRNGVPVVPSFPNGPYYLVGDRRFFGDPQWLTTGNPRGWQVRRLASPEAATCTGCHNIGDRRSCSDWAQWSIGIEHHSRQTNFSKTFNWMPASARGNWTHALTDTAHAAASEDRIAAVRFINHCCAHPDDARCVWEAPPPGRPPTTPPVGD